MAAEKKKSLKVSSPMADMEKNLKPDSDIVSILKKHKDLYQSDNRVVNPGCRLRSYAEVMKDPSPGFLVGRLVFREGDRIFDCSKKSPYGIGMPYMVNRIDIISSDALFILLVENNSAYMMLALKEFYNRFPCIIISSGKARPDMGTRMFLNMLYTELNLPVLALVDSTAQGLRSLYSYYQNEIDPGNLHIPDIKWLGMRPSDLNEHGMPDSPRLRMKRKDINMVNDLLKNESVKKNQVWVYEFNLILSTKQMAEIEVVDFKYLWEVYLPLMLQEQDWL